jgi:hypothetical protein
MATKPPIAVVSDGRVLRPADPYAAEQIEQLQRNVRLNARVTVATAKESRRSGMNSLFHAGLGLLVENLDDADTSRWPTVKKMKDSLLEELGFVERRYALDGKSYKDEPDSIAFDNMSDDDFEVFFERARAVVVARWGYDPWDAWIAEREAEKAAREELARSMGYGA